MNPLRNMIHWGLTGLTASLVVVAFVSSTAAQLTREQLATVRKEVENQVVYQWTHDFRKYKFAKIERERDELAAALAKLNERAKSDKLPKSEFEWIAEYREELIRMGDGLKALCDGYAKANEFEKSVGVFSNERLDDFLEQAINVSESKFKTSRDGVERAFDQSKKKSEAYHRALIRMQKSAVKHLADGNDWKPRVKDFSYLRKDMKSFIKQTVTRMIDAHDQLREDPAFQTAMKGSESDLCAICIQGRIKEATKTLQTWRPLRLEVAKDISEKLRQLPKQAGWIDVIVHGSPEKVQLHRNGKKVRADADMLFEVLNKKLDAQDLSEWQTLHKDLGKGIRLISCNTGRSPSGFAQELANLTGVKVKAPTRLVCLVRYQGQLHVILHDCPRCKTFEKKSERAMHILLSDQRGAWKTFTPNGDAKKELRDLLYEKAKQENWWQVQIAKVKLKKDLDETIILMQKLNSRLSEKDAREMLEQPKKQTFIAKQTRDQAIDVAYRLSKLGIQSRVVVMSKYQHEFRGIDVD